MVRAKTGEDRQLALYHPAGALTSPRVLVYDPDGTLEGAITMTASTVVADLYLADEDFNPSVIGEYELYFEHDPGGGFVDVFYDKLTSGLDPLSDFTLSSTVAQTFILDSDIVGDIVSTVTLKIIKEDDSLHEAEITATYDADYAGYVATVTTPISTAGAYYLAWFDDAVLNTTQILYSIVPKNSELVEVTLFDSTNSSTPHTGVTVLFSETDGTAVEQGLSDSNGKVSVQIPPNDYIVSLQKSGVTFHRNNFSLTVYDISKSTVVVQSPGFVEGDKLTLAASGTLFDFADPVVNQFDLDVEVFGPTWTTFSSGIDMCTLTATLIRFDGVPMANTDILISLKQGPANYSGVTAFGTAKVVRTDSNGYVEFDLIQGIEVEIAIMTHSLRRTITVPSSAGPVNLMTLLSAADDPFDVVVVSTPDAVRRSI